MGGVTRPRLTASRFPVPAYLPPMSSKSLAQLQLAGAALLFSTGGAAIKAAGFTGWQIASFRSGLAAVALWLMTPAARRGWTWAGALVGIAYAGCLTLFVLANRLTTAANTIFLQSTGSAIPAHPRTVVAQGAGRRQDLGFMAAVAAGWRCFLWGWSNLLSPHPIPTGETCWPWEAGLLGACRGWSHG